MILTEAEAFTLARLAATVTAERGDLPNALSSFSDPNMVEALALRVADAVYLGGEELTIGRAA